MTKRRIGVLLCGCGHRDGSEIHEATLTLLALQQAGAEPVCMAPHGMLALVRDHVTGSEVKEKRLMLQESARIARGKIRFAAQVKEEEIHGLIIPGGQGAALNLSTFLISGANCAVQPDVQRLVREMIKAYKPIGAICIAPATLARALQLEGVSATLTVGNDPVVSEAIESMGHLHQSCDARDCIVDTKHRIVTTPAYMNAESIGDVWEGIRKLVDAVLRMT